MVSPIEARFGKTQVSPAVSTHLADARAATVLTTATNEDAYTALTQTLIANAQDARRVKIGTTNCITVGLRDRSGVISQSIVEGRLGGSGVMNGYDKPRDVAFVATAVGTGENALFETQHARAEVEKVAEIILESVGQESVQ